MSRDVAPLPKGTSDRPVTMDVFGELAIFHRSIRNCSASW